MFEEIKSAPNKYTGRTMVFAYNKGYGLYALIINGTNQKSSENREVVENLSAIRGVRRVYYAL